MFLVRSIFFSQFLMELLDLLCKEEMYTGMYKNCCVGEFFIRIANAQRANLQRRKVDSESQFQRSYSMVEWSCCF